MLQSLTSERTTSPESWECESTAVKRARLPITRFAASFCLCVRERTKERRLYAQLLAFLQSSSLLLLRVEESHIETRNGRALTTVTSCFNPFQWDIANAFPRGFSLCRSLSLSRSSPSSSASSSSPPIRQCSSSASAASTSTSTSSSS